MEVRSTLIAPAGFAIPVAHDATLTGDGSGGSPLGVLSAPTGSTGVAVDATLTGDGKTATPLSVASAPTGSTGVAVDATLTGNGKTATPLSVVDPYLGVFRDGTLSGDGKATPLSVVSAPTGSTGVAVDATLTGNGKTATPLSVASAPTGSTGVAVDATLTGNGKTATPLSVVATAFAASTPARALNTTFAPDATKYTLVIYSVQIALTAGQDGNCELRSDAASPPTVARCSMRGACSGLIGDTNTMRMALVYIVPPGHNVRLVTAGTGTFALSTQTEITITG